MRQLTIPLVQTLGNNVLRAFRLRDYVGGGEPIATARAGGNALFRTACVLSLLFGPQRKRFIDLGGRGAAELLLQVHDTLLRRFQFSLGCNIHIGWSIRFEPSFPQVVLELLGSIHVESITDPANRENIGFRDWTATSRTPRTRFAEPKHISTARLLNGEQT